MKKLNAIVITCGMKMGFSNFDLVGKMYLILTFIIMRGEYIYWDKYIISTQNGDFLKKH